MKRIDLIDATVQQMEDWIRSQLQEEPRVLFATDYRDDPTMYAVELENLISDAIADEVEAGRDLQ